MSERSLKSGEVVWFMVSRARMREAALHALAGIANLLCPGEVPRMIVWGIIAARAHIR